MADVKLALQAAQTLTNAIQSLGSSASWLAGYESATIDNTTNLYEDYIFDGKVTVGTTPTAGTEIRIYVAETVDGTNWGDVLDGTTSAETIVSEGVRDSFLKLAAVLFVDATTSDRSYPFCFTIAALFGGIVPPKFSLFVAHNTGVNLNSNGGNQVFNYRGTYHTVI